MKKRDKRSFIKKLVVVAGMSWGEHPQVILASQRSPLVGRLRGHLWYTLEGLIEPPWQPGGVKGVYSHGGGAAVTLSEYHQASYQKICQVPLQQLVQMI